MNVFVKSVTRNERNFNEAEKPATNNWQPIERLVSHDPDTCLITDMIQKALKDVLWLADIAYQFEIVGFIRAIQGYNGSLLTRRIPSSGL